MSAGPSLTQGPICWPLHVRWSTCAEHPAVCCTAHLAMAGYIRARDPSRPVHYEGGGARTAATDILCPMYARIGQVRLGSSTRLNTSLLSCTLLRMRTNGCAGNILRCVLQNAPAVGVFRNNALPVRTIWPEDRRLKGF